MSYKVKLDIFEGPFDLLVYLIENAEMRIYDIEVSKITDQYLQYIENMQAMDVVVGSDFMVLAAALIEIKSKMLLPRLRPEGEDSLEDDPREELVQRLLEYKKFKNASEFLQMKEEVNLRIYEKPKEDLTRYTNEPDEYLSLSIEGFVSAFLAFVTKKKKVEEIQRNYAKVERQKLSIESRIKQIKDLFIMKSKKLLNFRELLTPESKRYDVVLTFVSLLEMVRQKRVTLKQTRNFGDITLSLIEEGKDDK